MGEPGELAFFLGGYDLEMVTIRELLEHEAPGRYYDRQLAWGARASAYAAQIAAELAAGRTTVLVELELDQPLPEGRYVLVDHHGPRSGRDRPTSLEQVFALLQLPAERWTRWLVRRRTAGARLLGPPPAAGGRGRCTGGVPRPARHAVAAGSRLTSAAFSRNQNNGKRNTTEARQTQRTEMKAISASFSPLWCSIFGHKNARKKTRIRGIVIRVGLWPPACVTEDLMKFTREMYLDLMTFGHAPRPMFSELFGPLVGLDREWQQQGATRDEIEMAGFDWDYVPYIDCGGICVAWGTPEPQILEETAEHVILRDYLGRRSMLVKGTATLPLPLEFPVRTMDDWLRLKPYFLFSEARIDADAVERARRAQNEGVLVRAEIPGGWDMARELMGEEQACLAYYEQPELMQDILDTLRETSVRVLERVTQRLTIDQLFVHEDMAGKSGPLIGPSQVRQFVGPYYRACWEVVSGGGTRLFNQDSDGNMNPVIDAFLDCGVNVMHPFEPAAGMDMVATRQKYGTRLAILGGIDKHVLRCGKEEIRRELEYKMQPLMRQGGTVFGLDHRIPNGTPLENYRYYVTLGREILGLPPLDGKSRGWGRMAF